MEGAHNEIFPEIDVPFDQSPWPRADVAIRTTGDPEALRKSVGAIITSMDPNLPMANVKTMDQIVDETFLEDRSVSGLFAVFAVAALLLAAIGIYGVMSFSVAQRTHEIGLRMALGADRSNVMRLILREGLILALLGLAVGLLGGVLVGRAVQKHCSIRWARSISRPCAWLQCCYLPQPCLLVIFPLAAQPRSIPWWR